MVNLILKGTNIILWMRKQEGDTSESTRYQKIKRGDTVTVGTRNICLSYKTPPPENVQS